MAALPFVPGTQPPGAAEVGGLVAPPAAAQPVEAGVDERARGVMLQVRDIQQGVENLARQFPAVADLMEQVKQLLVQAMVKVVGSQTGPEAPGPPVLG